MAVEETGTSGIVVEETGAVVEQPNNVETDGSIDTSNEVVEETGETGVVDEEVEEGNEGTEEAPIEDLFGEEDLVDKSLYQIAGYDLSKYKEMGLDLEDKESSQEFVDYIGKFKEQGFTQEQVDFIISDKLEEASKEKVKEPKKKLTREEIKENLNQNLSLEEKRNYKSINRFLGDSLQGTGLESYQDEIVTNPMLVKLVNAMYKKSLGKTTNINKVSQVKQGKEQIVNKENASDLFFNEVENVKGRLTPEIKSDIINKIIKKSGNNASVKDVLEKYL